MENLLYSSVAVGKKYGYYERPAFHQARSHKGMVCDWPTFRETFRPVAAVDLTAYTGDPTELLLTDKDVSWSTKDLNLWIGGPNREINEIVDMTDREGEIFLGTGLELLKSLSEQTGDNHLMAIGFNPKDIGRPGNHNIKRIHAHLRAYNYEPDVKTIQDVSMKDMSWFNRLTFLEPFTPIFFDFMKHYFSTTISQTFDFGKAEMSDGKIIMPVAKVSELQVFREVSRLYGSMKAEHFRIEGLFTNREVDATTGRYIPLERSERQSRVAGYVGEDRYLSDRSQRLLTYLGDNLLPAAPWSENRDEYIMKPNQIYISKGFAGAMVFDYDAKSGGMNFQFLPRVITTSSVAKTMFGADRPTIMGKHVPATTEQRMSQGEYKEKVVSILKSLFKPQEVQLFQVPTV